jgi:hypothetical protein
MKNTVETVEKLETFVNAKLKKATSPKQIIVKKEAR